MQGMQRVFVMLIFLLFMFSGSMHFYLLCCNGFLAIQALSILLKTQKIYTCMYIYVYVHIYVFSNSLCVS